MQSDVYMRILSDAYDEYNEAYNNVVKDLCTVTLRKFDLVYEAIGLKREAYLDAAKRDKVQPEDRFYEIIDDIGQKHVDVMKRRIALM